MVRRRITDWTIQGANAHCRLAESSLCRISVGRLANKLSCIGRRMDAVAGRAERTSKLPKSVEPILTADNGGEQRMDGIHWPAVDKRVIVGSDERTRLLFFVRRGVEVGQRDGDGLRAAVCGTGSSGRRAAGKAWGAGSSSLGANNEARAIVGHRGGKKNPSAIDRRRVS